MFFENEELESIIKKQIKKDQITKDDIKNINSLDISGIEKLSQHDIDLLSNIPYIRYNSLDLSNVTFSNINSGTMTITGCKLDNIKFEDAKIKNLTINNCIDNENLIAEIANVDGLKRLDITYKDEMDMSKVPPNSFVIKSFVDPRYVKEKKIDLKDIKKITSLEHLFIKGMGVKISQDNLDDISQLENLEGLSLRCGAINKGLVLPHMRNLTDLVVENIESCDFFKNNTELTDVEMTQKGTNIENLEVLEGLKNLNSLSINGALNVEKDLPKLDNVNDLSLTNCGLESLDILYKFKKLDKVALDRNNLGENLKENVLKAKRDLGIKQMSFNRTNLEKALEKTEFKFDDPVAEEHIRKLLCVAGNPINAKLALESNRNEKIIPGIDTFLEIEKNGLLKFMSTNAVYFKDFKYVTDNQLEKINSNLEVVKVKRIAGLTADKMDAMPNIRYAIEGDLKVEFLEKTYSKEDMKYILDVFDNIKSQIPKEASELEKFMHVYKFLGNNIGYDRSGNQGDEELIEENVVKTRSIKDILQRGKAVCSGYSVVLNNLLSHIGVESRIMGGMAKLGERVGPHAWNQVRIDNKWYNVDLTWDSKKMHQNQALGDCLIDDTKFYEAHNTSQKKKLCAERYDQEKINEVYNKIELPKNEPIGPYMGKVVKKYKFPKLTEESLKKCTLEDFEEQKMVRENAELNKSTKEEVNR